MVSLFVSLLSLLAHRGLNYCYITDVRVRVAAAAIGLPLLCFFSDKIGKLLLLTFYHHHHH